MAVVQPHSAAHGGSFRDVCSNASLRASNRHGARWSVSREHIEEHRSRAGLFSNPLNKTASTKVRTQEALVNGVPGLSAAPQA